MSSIDDKKRKILVEFYETHVLPLAAHPETARLEPSRDGEADSFYYVRPKTRLEKADFEVPLRDAAQVADTLSRMWSGTPLAAVARELLALTKQFDETEEKSEVSAFIYEMF